MAKKNSKKKEDKSFEDKLWEAAEKLRGPLESAQYKYVVLGLLFLKFASDIYQNRRDYLEKETKNPDNKEYYQKNSEAREYVINDPDEYHKESVLFIKKGNTWSELMKTASQENLGIKIDKILNEIESSNPVLQGVMPKVYSEVKLPNENITELINLFSSIKHGQSRGIDFDFLGRTYEFFLGKFSSQEDSRSGEFYTPDGVVKLITEILEPINGIVFDPTCGSGGMFVQSMKYHQMHEKNYKNNLSFYAQEFKEGIWQLCKMNLILRGIDTTNVKQGDSLVNDQHKLLKADYIIANPPFNMKEWGYNQLTTDKRWKYGLPTYSKAGGNYAFMQHMLHHLNEKNGMMGLVLTNASLTAPHTEETIRQKIIENDLVDCVITLADKLFFTVTLSVSVWFFSMNKNDGKKRKRNGETLFIHAKHIFEKVDSTHNKISTTQIKQIADTYHSYVGKKGYPKYKDTPGFCKVVTTHDIAKKKFSAVPGRYVAIKEIEESFETFEENMRKLTLEYAKISKESVLLDKEVRKNLKDIGFAI